MSGHSKWHNIQHKKGAVDAARSGLFTKLAREITMAAKLGDKNPDNNPRLRLAILNARKNSMPNDMTILNAQLTKHLAQILKTMWPCGTRVMARAPFPLLSRH